MNFIGKGAFVGSGLTCFYLPGSVSSIGGSSFSQCPLKDFEICESNVFFEVFDGLLLSKDRRVCYSCTGELEEIVVPDCVEELFESCFWCCESLLRVTFGESSSLRRIAERAFLGSGVREIHTPDGIGHFLMDRSTGLPPLCCVDQSPSQFVDCKDNRLTVKFIC